MGGPEVPPNPPKTPPQTPPGGGAPYIYISVFFWGFRDLRTAQMSFQPVPLLRSSDGSFNITFGGVWGGSWGGSGGGCPGNQGTQPGGTRFTRVLGSLAEDQYAVAYCFFFCVGFFAWVANTDTCSRQHARKEKTRVKPCALKQACLVSTLPRDSASHALVFRVNRKKECLGGISNFCSAEDC